MLGQGRSVPWYVHYGLLRRFDVEGATVITPATLMPALLLVTLSGTVWAGDFDGWCFMQDECDRASKIINDRFSTCDEYCTLTRPTKVTGLDGQLYNVVCEGDGGSTHFRMLLMRYRDTEGKSRALAIDQNGSQELQRCKGE